MFTGYNNVSITYGNFDNFVVFDWKKNYKN